MFLNFLKWLKNLFVKSQTSPPSPVVAPATAWPDNFPFAVSYLLANEGGYSNSPTDPGGPTNYGITLATLTRWRNRPELKLDHVVVVTAADVKAMSVDEAKAIYHQWYWIDVGLNLIKSKSISICLLDQSALEGQATAVRYAQLAANNCGASLSVDGGCGPNTRAAFEQVDLGKFLVAFHAQLKSHYDQIMARRPDQKANYAGWMARANRLLTLSIL